MSLKVHRKEIKVFAENWGHGAQFVAEVGGREIGSSEDLLTLLSMIDASDEAFSYENMKEEEE